MHSTVLFFTLKQLLLDDDTNQNDFTSIPFVSIRFDSMYRPFRSLFFARSRARSDPGGEMDRRQRVRGVGGPQGRADQGHHRAHEGRVQLPVRLFAGTSQQDRSSTVVDGIKHPAGDDCLSSQTFSDRAGHRRVVVCHVFLMRAGLQAFCYTVQTSRSLPSV